MFSAVTNKEFKKISSTNSANEARTVLQNTYEGTKAVKDSKFQRFTTSFKEIRMDDDEAFDEFYAKIKDIVNSAFNLGEKILEPKIVRKILRSLPERFHAKITAIEESKDINTIPLTEFIVNLQTYELDLVRIGKGSKSKNMALKAKNDEEDESSKDENSKFKSYITKPKSSSRMQMSRQMTRIANSLDFLNLSLKINSRENPKKLDKAATLRPVQIAMGVKGMDT